jgi:hypothetical protein
VLVDTARSGVMKIAGAALYEPDAIDLVPKIAGAAARELGAVTSVIKDSGAVIYESIVPVIEFPPGTGGGLPGTGGGPSEACFANVCAQPPARSGCGKTPWLSREYARRAWGGKPPVRLCGGSTSSGYGPTARLMAGLTARPGREPVARAGRC